MRCRVTGCQACVGWGAPVGDGCPFPRSRRKKVYGCGLFRAQEGDSFSCKGCKYIEGGCPEQYKGLCGFYDEKE
jgi:hypothetical protein